MCLNIQSANAVPNFNGEDKGFGVNEFLQMFEDLMYQIRADEIFKLVSLRRKLKDTAACLIDSPDAITYEGLKAQLVRTFGRRMTMSQAESYIRVRKWDKGNETLLKYVLVMERLRRQLSANRFTKTEFVDILLRGMNLPPLYANMLSFPRTLDKLKDRMHRFEEELSAYAKTSANKDPSVLVPKPVVKPTSIAKPMPTSVPDSNILCFNCCKLGHYQSRCPYEKRPANSCFKCWEIGHSHRACPNRRRPIMPMNSRNMPVGAAVMPDDADSMDTELMATFDAMNLVSIRLFNETTRGKEFFNVPSLFDTGSPVSFIRCSQLPKAIAESLTNKNTEVLNLTGLGFTRLKMLKKCYLK